MNPKVYYNDNDQKSCAWLRELIRAGEIPDGVVDERSILDVQPADVAGFVQCHFFAGIGGWSYALKLAGWPEDRPVWTGSCPCQPYSAAGRGKGDADARNLWPAFFRLIKARKPEFVIGEQVSAAISHGWLDGICDDLEGEGYATGSAVLGAFSVGAPHIRKRLYWVGHTQGIGRIGGQNNEDSRRRELTSGHSGAGDGGVANPQCHAGEPGWPANQSAESIGARTTGPSGESGRSGLHGGMADSTSPRRIGPIREPESQTRDEARMFVSGEHGENGGLEHAAGDGREQRRATSGERGTERGCGTGGVDDTNSGRCGESADAVPTRGNEPVSSGFGMGHPHEPGSQGRVISGNGPGERIVGASGLGFWDDCELTPCADGKQRRIESGSKPLVASVPRGMVPGGDPGVEEAQNSGEARVMRLRGYGNAINTVTASEFIKAVMDCC